MLAYVPTAGTLIHGTHRAQDLIPCFMQELQLCDAATLHSLLTEYDLHRGGFADIDDDHEFWQSDDAHELLADLFAMLNEHAPDGHYFGAHPGDGADFGFWLIDDEE